MKKITLGLFLMIVCLGTSFFLIGCQNQKIIFNRESQAAQIIQKFTNKDDQVKRSSGVIILKDDDNKENNIHFGPKDIVFDMPIKFK